MYYVMRKGKVITDSIRFWEIIALETSESNVSVSYSKYFCWRIHVRINKSLSINHTVRLHIHVTIFTLAFRSFGTAGEGDLVRITRELKRQISHSAWHFAFVDPSADVLHIITLGHWIIEGVFHGWKLETLFLRVGLSRLFPIQCIRLVAIPVSREVGREDMFCYPYDVFRYAKWTGNAINMNRNIGNVRRENTALMPAGYEASFAIVVKILLDWEMHLSLWSEGNDVLNRIRHLLLQQLLRVKVLH